MKRFLSCVLALSMVCSLVPTPALAEAVSEFEPLVVEAEAAPEEGVPELEPESVQEEIVPEPEVESELEAELEPEAYVEQESNLELEPEPDAEPSEQEVLPEGEADAEPALEPEPDAEPSEQEVLPEGEADAEPALEEQAAADPFYFQDYKTGERVTTLHTSGTYLLVAEDGSPYQSYLGSCYFEIVGTNARGHEGSYDVYVKQLEVGEDEEIQLIALENIAETADGFQLPSGTYRINIGWAGNPTYLNQRYQVVNDGNFRAYFDFSSEYGSENNGAFSVKPYTEGATDLEYDGGNDDEGYIVEPSIAAQEPFALASDVRLNITIESDVSMSEDVMPQIESVGLWKADEPLETLLSTVDPDTDELVGKYAPMYWRSISRVQEFLAEVGLSELPAWPNNLNFNDDAKVTTLWQRSDGDLGERISLDAYNVSIGDCYYTRVIVDRVSFADAVAEDGLYFPVVKATIGGEPYTYAYFPIQVSAEGAAERKDPTITTTSLAQARVGDAYSATLAGKTGAVTPGTFTWKVTSGKLPAGLKLNASTGAITGTPTAAGTSSFTVTLTEDVGGDKRTVSKAFELTVRAKPNPSTAFDELSLGEISYTPGTIWMPSNYNQDVFANLRIPISIDVRDAAYDLGQTELWYMVKLRTAYDRDDQPTYYVYHELAADLMNEDGTTLEVAAPLKQGIVTGTTEVIRVRAFLIPKTNAGEYAFDLGQLVDPYDNVSSGDDEREVLPLGVTMAMQYGAEPADAVVNDDGSTTELQSYSFVGEDGYTTYAHPEDWVHYVGYPKMPYTALERPDITIGSWVHFPSLSFGDDKATWPTTTARVRMWPYDGTTTPTKQTTETIYPIDSWNHYSEGSAGATLKLEPGTYAFVVEGSVPAFDDEGNQTDEWQWVDIVGRVGNATVLEGTYPRQYVINVGPGQGTQDEPAALDVTYSGETIEFYRMEPRFEREDGSFEERRDADYETAWYRRVKGKDVLVATGDIVSLVASDDPLYVEVTPQDRSAAFWKGTGKVAVSAQNHVVSLDVPRKRLFSGTFTLSCASGYTPAAGQSWGIVEVETPLEKGGVSSFNLWADSNPVRVPNLTSGSVVTFTPRVDLDGASVSYTVPESADKAFSAALVAPLAHGTITFEGLSFVDVDGTTKAISLDDGSTGVTVKRIQTHADGTTEAFETPFFQVDGSRIILQSSYSGESLPFEREETAYEVVVTRHGSNPDASPRLGTSAADYAAQRTFAITLSPEQPTATIQRATLTSRGYADVTLGNTGTRPYSLLLYNDAGDLVDQGPAGAYGQLRTAYLDAGSYTLYSVDSGLLSRGKSSYETVDALQGGVLIGEWASHGTKTERFEVRDAEVTRVRDFVMPDWELESLVNLANCSVSAQASYTDKVSISMHAELAKGVTLSDDARLEIVTNQASGESGQGYMSPKALNLNGRAITLNRWDNLFAQTQNMVQGNLTLLLSEAKKTAATCAEFPLDMTLVVPRTNFSAIDVGIYLVDPKANMRSLVGAYHRDTPQMNLTAPAIVAWKDFYVYGETAPNAYVNVFVEGMRAATTYADSYGYYSAQITLPGDVRDWDEFTLSASAQWSDLQGGHAATSETSEVVYSTIFPVVERMTMCYQPDVGADYVAVTTYYRGYMPNKYLSLYRAEHDTETQGDDHAKIFWMAEFANGGEVSNVTMSTKLSTSTLVMPTTDSLNTAGSWIPDVRNATDTYSYSYYGYGWRYGPAGHVVRSALTSNDLHAFVSKPVYLTVSADELEVSFDFDDDLSMTLPMAESTRQDRFEGYSSSEVDEGELAALIDAMATVGNVRSVTAAEAGNLTMGKSVTWDSLSSATTRSRSLKGATAGTVDSWLLVGSSVDPEADEENSLLKVHHQVASTDLTRAQIASEVNAVLTEAHRVTDPYEAWLYDGGTVPTGNLEVYKGNYVAHAVSERTTEDESYRYYITTVNDAGDVQIEVFMEFLVEDSDAHMYLRVREDKGSMAITSWDEQNGQRVETTYTLASDQVTSGRASFYEVFLLWDIFVEAVTTAVCDGGAELEAMSAQAVSEDAEDALYAQDPISEAAGFYGGAARDQGIAWAIKRKLGLDKVDANTIKQRREANDYTKFENIERVSKNGSRAKDFQKDVKVAKDGVGGAVVDGAVSVGTAYVTGGLTNAPVKTAVGAVATPALAGGVQKKTEGLLDDIADSWDNWWKNRRYRNEYRQRAWRRRKNQMLPGDKDYFNKLALDNPKLANEFARRFKAEAAKWEKTHGKQNGIVQDPSGIVYEAVLSNPVEGATVKLYTYNNAAASVGYDPAQFIDSSQFGIEDNPQVTGPDGRYQWFVPEGYWQIRVSKPGYSSVSTGDSGEYGIDATRDLDGDGTDDAESYWMPVLPIQLDVNIPLVSLETPKVETIEGDQTGVTVTFSKYVRPETVTKELFAIKGKVPASIEAVDADTAGDGSGAVYASTFKLAYPADLKLAMGTNRLTVTYDDPNGAVTSYAGVAVGAQDRSASENVYVYVSLPSITDADVAAIADQTYTGSAVMPEPVVTMGGTTLKKDTDYTVVYKNNIKVGTASVVIEGKEGAYSGSLETSFKIVPASIAKASIAAIADQTYTGKAIAPKPAVKLGSATLEEGKDYTLSYANNVNAGTATITLTGKGNYAGSVSKQFTIARASIDKASIGGISNKTYTGKAITQSVVVKDGSVTLAEGTDYTVSYKNNVNAGTATITLTGKGNFTGSKRATFTIAPASIAKATIAAIADQAYTGKAIAPKPAVKLGSATLRLGTDYTLSYKANVNAGKATVTATGKGNYTGTVSRTFTILAPEPEPEPKPEPAPAPRTFPDVPAGAWYAKVVGRAAALGLIGGFADGTFGPDRDITRGQVAVILWRMAGQPAPAAGARAFPDVAPGAYYARAVAWASSVGVVGGFGDGTFGPERNVTREQLAVMLANYAGRVGGMRVSGSAADFASMSDARSVSPWAAKSVSWCFRNGIISGKGGTRIDPQGNTTRAQAAKMLVFLHDML